LMTSNDIQLLNIKHIRLSVVHLAILSFLFIIISLIYYSDNLLGYNPSWLWYLKWFEFISQFHGSLFCIPIIYAAVTFGITGVAVVWIITVAIVIPIALNYYPSITTVLINLFYLFIPVLIVGYIHLELSWRNKERKTLQEREKEREAYVTQIFKAQEDERKRFAQELHDDAIHSMLVIANNLQRMTKSKKEMTQRQTEEQLSKIQDEVLRVSEDLRRLSLDLRPSVLDNFGFLAALKWLISQITQEDQVDANMVINGTERLVPHGPDLIMFRIVQEALNNIRDHASATKALLTVDFGADTIKITIWDNGIGFAVPDRIDLLPSEGKLGLMGIKERVKSLNAVLAIESNSVKGTSISVEFKI
jgi:two-component system, NarL family, sensor histidine kinase DegS